MSDEGRPVSRAAQHTKVVREALESMQPPELQVDYLIASVGADLVRLDEVKTIVVPKGGHIRIEAPRHGGGGQVHGHIYGRSGNQLLVVNLDGTGSHGTKGVLSRPQAAILKANGFSIRPDRVVEWYWVVFDNRVLLLG